VPTAPVLRQEQRTKEFPKDLSLVDEGDAARFAEKSLGLARRFRMIGAFWGCYGDYHPTIWSWPPLDRNVSERFLGLVRDDGSRKPAAEVFASGMPDQPRTEPTAEWLDIDATEFLETPKALSHVSIAVSATLTGSDRISWPVAGGSRQPASPPGSEIVSCQGRLCVTIRSKKVRSLSEYLEFSHLGIVIK
jgi:hypothetical protein